MEAFVSENQAYQAICITETWLSRDKLSIIDFTGYRIAASYCRSNRGGGGVCILLEEHKEYIEKSDITAMSLEYILEVCAIEISNEGLLLVTMYWNRREENLFYNQLNQILAYINNKYTKLNVVIGGDFNINILTKNSKVNTLLNLMSEYKYTQHIKQPTHITQTASTCLDLIFTNFKNIDLCTYVEELGFSDHCGTIIKFKIPQRPKQTTWYTEKRLYNKNNIESFKSALKSINWRDIIRGTNDANQNYNVFNDVLINLLNKTIPKIKTKLKTHYKKYWLSKGIKISCTNKRLLKILSIKTDNPIIKKYYRKYEKILKQSVITSKKQHYINKIKMSQNKVKAMWNIVNERTNKKTPKDKYNIQLQIDNTLVSDPKQIVNTFNNFFASIGEESSREAKGQPVVNPSENTLFLRPLDCQETHRIIQNLKNKRSHGIDELPPSLIRQCADELAVPFCVLINQSFDEGTFPDQLKKAIIKPLFKKNSKTDPNNYRPIALLPTASKIFEKAMCDRVYSFCERYKIFDESQNGFRKHRSTTLAVYKYMQEVTNIINNKKYAIGILLDMTKAYDKVQFKILLEKLYGIGIRGNTHKWFTSYLQNREQYVQMEYFNHDQKRIIQVRSEKKIINASIPQGSVIGCLLFIIYINDLPKIMKEPCVLFADDISLLTTCQSNSNINEQLNIMLNKTTKWMDEHNLEINYKKTKLMTFYPQQKSPLEVNFAINGTKVEVVNEFTLLGLTIDTHITWKPHINKLHSKLSKFTYALREVKKTTDIQTALTTYYAYAHAWLSYGIIMWGNSTDAPTLFILQKKLIRIIVNIEQTDSCKPFFIKHSILTLPSIYILEICKFVRKYIHFFKTRGDKHTDRSVRYRNMLMLPSSRMKLHSNSPYVMSIKIFNNLPDALKDETNDTTFINKLKQILIKKAYYTINEYIHDKKIDLTQTDTILHR